MNDASCYSDFALQEFVAGRLAREVRAALEEHLGNCPDCTEALNAFQREQNLLIAAMQNAEEDPTSADSEDPLLAQYLDGSLSSRACEVLEKRLAEEPALLARLVWVYRELLSLSREEGEAEATPHTGLILQIPKRTKREKTLLETLEDRLRYGSG